MKNIACFLLANLFFFTAISSFAAGTICDPSDPCKTKPADTTAKKPVVKMTVAPAQVQPSAKPTAKKDEKKTSAEFVSPFSWKPAFLY